MSLRRILSERQFGALFWTQLLTSLNDNFLKNALAILITYKGVVIGFVETKWLVALLGGLYLLPFLLFSSLAGQIGDKFEKTRIIRIAKMAEMVIVLVGVAGFFTENYLLLLLIVFLLGTHSAFFSPVKYSVLPQLVESKQLVEANAHVQLGTFGAILIGWILAGVAIAATNFEFSVSIAMFLIAQAGIVTANRLSPVKVGAPHLIIRFHLFPALARVWRLSRENRVVFNSILGASWFWFFSAGVVSILPVYCRDYLGSNEQVVTLFIAVFTLGIGLGSMLCSKLSFGKVELGLVPIGSLGMTIFLLDVFFIQAPWVNLSSINGAVLITVPEFFKHVIGYRLVFDFFFMAIFGGIFITPLYSIIQKRTRDSVRSRVIAGNNMMNTIAMIFSSLLVISFYWLNLTLPEIFIILAILNLLVATYIYSWIPEFTLRLWSWAVVHLLYRLHVNGYDNIPERGPVILACNHVSFVDWLVIMGAMGRPTRFIMYYKYYDVPVAKHLMRQAKVIRIASRKEDPTLLDDAYETVSHALQRGEVICLFPEGQVTYDGALQPFKPGILKILSRDSAPIVPMALNGLYLSMFSRRGGKAFFKLPRKLWKPIYLNIGKPIAPEEFTLELLHERIEELIDPTHDRE
jgi:1-acyl-sn-glycerol-3-phosphate acyltransferase